MDIITSRANPVIKNAGRLSDGAFRKETGLFLLEGARLCLDAALSGVEIKEAFFTGTALTKYSAECEKTASVSAKNYEISDEVADKLSDTKNTQGVFAVGVKPASVPALMGGGVWIMTDSVQNPDNLGAISRSAEALGARGLIVSGGCDIYSPKALRASMGALIRFPVITVSSPRMILEPARKSGFRVYSTVVTPDAFDITAADRSGSVILVIGNEGSGVSQETLGLTDLKVTIRMKGKAESLNAAAAAAIAIWEMTK